MKKKSKKSRLINLGGISDEVSLEKGLYDITASPMAYSKGKGKKKKVWGEYASWMDRGLGPKGIKMKDVPGWNKIKAFNEWRQINKESKMNESVDGSVLYHTTSIDRLESILKQGLRINSDKGYSTGSLEYMKEVYGAIPVFVSLDHGAYGMDDKNTVTLIIDGRGLELVSDIPSLVDKGAYIDEEMQGIWFKRGRNIIDPINDPELIHFSDLLDPDSPYCERAIEVTRTAAVLEDIPADLITIM